jgi:hypothetical protein
MGISALENSPTQDPPDLWNRDEYSRRGLQVLPKLVTIYLTARCHIKEDRSANYFVK